MINKKKILYISYDGMTDPLGQSQVIPYLIELTKLGHHFTILSVEKKERLRKNGALISQILSKAGIIWKTIPFNTIPPLLSKLYDQYKLTSAAIRLHKEHNFDFVHCRSYVAAATGLKLYQRFQLPFLFDMRGFWVDERVDSGLWNLKNPLYKQFYKIYKRKEKSYFGKASHIISLTRKGEEELTNHFLINHEKITVIPCCADLNHFNFHNVSELQRKEIRDVLKINEQQKVISYLGSLGGWYMTDEMLDLFVHIRKSIPDSVFLLITHDEAESIIKKANSRGIPKENIRVQPASRNEVPLFLSVSDWSVFFIKDLYSKKASSPTKQGEIMAMGIPIICNDIGDTGEILRETGTGLVVNEFNHASFELVIRQLEELLTIDKDQIRNAAIKYYDLSNGVTSYNDVYSKMGN